MHQTIIISERFRGPPESGNGGYVCGLVATFIDGPAEVTLRRPPPLEQPMLIGGASDGRIVARYMDEIIAEGRPVKLELGVPDPPSLHEAQLASHRYIGFSRHDYPTCFVCGPSRSKKDGLSIFPGSVSGREFVAGPWMPDETLVDNAGFVRSEFIWAALDCPGYFALYQPEGPSRLLGRLTAEIKSQIQIGESYVVIGWPIGKNGRKAEAGTAIYSTAGELCAFAKAIWIELKEPPPKL